MSDTCQMDGIKMLYGADATVESVGVQVFEGQQVALDSARALGRELAQKIKSLER